MRGYKVYRGGNLVSGTDPITTMSFEEANLMFSTAYSYTVTAVDYAGNNSVATPPSNISTTSFTDNFNTTGAALSTPWETKHGSITISQNQAKPITTSGATGPWIFNSAAYPDEREHCNR